MKSEKDIEIIQGFKQRNNDGDIKSFIHYKNGELLSVQFIVNVHTITLTPQQFTAFCELVQEVITATNNPPVGCQP